MSLPFLIYRFSDLASRAFYRLTITGGRVPAAGPILLVANHPNSLLDPMLVATAAGRPVRFLAKAPLFTDKRVGFLVRGAASIPVYRRMDDPSAMGGNDDMFRSAFEALEDNAAIALFPEGASHSEPSITRLKTGAARIALGEFDRTKKSFPIIPIGLVLKQKDVFRSKALVVVGEAIEWSDLAPRGQHDREAARELTRRIDSSIRDITVNLDTWDDRPIVECAAKIWSAEFEADDTATGKLGRLRIASDLLPTIRESGESDWQVLLKDIESHQQQLHILGLSPLDLSTDIRIRTAFRWALGRLYLLGPPSLVIALAGFLFFLPPNRATGFIAERSGADEAELSTWKLLIGIPMYTSWVALVGLFLGVRFGPAIGFSACLLGPVVGATGLWLRERGLGISADMRRFFLLRGRAELIAGLRTRQAAIANRMADLVRYL